MRWRGASSGEDGDGCCGGGAESGVCAWQTSSVVSRSKQGKNKFAVRKLIGAKSFAMGLSTRTSVAWGNRAAARLTTHLLLDPSGKRERKFQTSGMRLLEVTSIGIFRKWKALPDFAGCAKMYRKSARSVQTISLLGFRGVQTVPAAGFCDSIWLNRKTLAGQSILAQMGRLETLLHSP
jgi:hypothetical protein